METTTVPVKSAWKSKINWTQAVGAGAMILTLATGNQINITPTEQAAIVTTIGVATGIVTWVMKTFFTSSVHPSSMS